MASNKQYTVEIRMNEDAELGTVVLFFQVLVRAMAKFGLTYFKEATVSSNFRELMRYETSTYMTTEIKEFHNSKMQEQALKSQSEPQDVN